MTFPPIMRGRQMDSDSAMSSSCNPHVARWNGRNESGMQLMNFNRSAPRDIQGPGTSHLPYYGQGSAAASIAPSTTTSYRSDDESIDSRASGMQLMNFNWSALRDMQGSGTSHLPYYGQGSAPSTTTSYRSDDETIDSRASAMQLMNFNQSAPRNMQGPGTSNLPYYARGSAAASIAPSTTTSYRSDDERIDSRASAMQLMNFNQSAPRNMQGPGTSNLPYYARGSAAASIAPSTSTSYRSDDESIDSRASGMQLMNFNRSAPRDMQGPGTSHLPYYGQESGASKAPFTTTSFRSDVESIDSRASGMQLMNFNRSVPRDMQGPGTSHLQYYGQGSAAASKAPSPSTLHQSAGSDTNRPSVIDRWENLRSRKEDVLFCKRNEKPRETKITDGAQRKGLSSDDSDTDNTMKGKQRNDKKASSSRAALKVKPRGETKVTDGTQRKGLSSDDSDTDKTMKGKQRNDKKASSRRAALKVLSSEESSDDNNSVPRLCSGAALGKKDYMKAGPSKARTTKLSLKKSTVQELKHLLSDDSGEERETDKRKRSRMVRVKDGNHSEDADDPPPLRKTTASRKKKVQPPRNSDEDQQDDDNGIAAKFSADNGSSDVIVILDSEESENEKMMSRPEEKKVKEDADPLHYIQDDNCSVCLEDYTEGIYLGIFHPCLCKKACFPCAMQIEFNDGICHWCRRDIEKVTSQEFTQN